MKIEWKGKKDVKAAYNPKTDVASGRVHHIVDVTVEDRRVPGGALNVKIEVGSVEQAKVLETALAKATLAGFTFGTVTR